MQAVGTARRGWVRLDAGVRGCQSYCQRRADPPGSPKTAFGAETGRSRIADAWRRGVTYRSGVIFRALLRARSGSRGDDWLTAHALRFNMSDGAGSRGQARPAIHSHCRRGPSISRSPTGSASRGAPPPEPWGGTPTAREAPRIPAGPRSHRRGHPLHRKRGGSSEAPGRPR